MVVFKGLRLTQGSMGLEADEGRASKLDFKDSVWQLSGNVTIDVENGHIECALQVDSDGQVVVGGNAYLGAGGPSGDGTITLVGDDDSVATLKVMGDLFVGGDKLASIGQGRLGMEGQTRVKANRVVNWDQGEIKLAGVVDVGLNNVENHGLFSGQGKRAAPAR